jgi:uncharacterized protein
MRVAPPLSVLYGLSPDLLGYDGSMAETFFDFDWDPKKARSNLKKHGVSFRLATSVFRDPLALTIFDEDHSANEERWVSIGCAESGQTLVVVHTSEWTSPTEIKVRIISARKADHVELHDYENAPR